MHLFLDNSWSTDVTQPVTVSNTYFRPYEGIGTYKVACKSFDWGNFDIKRLGTVLSTASHRPISSIIARVILIASEIDTFKISNFKAPNRHKTRYILNLVMLCTFIHPTNHTCVHCQACMCHRHVISILDTG